MKTLFFAWIVFVSQSNMAGQGLLEDQSRTVSPNVLTLGEGNEQELLPFWTDHSTVGFSDGLNHCGDSTQLSAASQQIPGQHSAEDMLRLQRAAAGVGE